MLCVTFDHQEDIGTTECLALYKIKIQSSVLVENVRVCPNVTCHFIRWHAERFEDSFFIIEVGVDLHT